MSRVEIYKKEEAERFAELVESEIALRANAAKVLAEPFNINGVHITCGCSDKGAIRVYDGIDLLAEAAGQELSTEDEKYGDTIFTYKRFCFREIVFEQLIGSRKVAQE